MATLDSVVARLLLLSPEQSKRRALWAIARLRKGDWLPLAERFNLSRALILMMRADIEDHQNIVDVLDRWLNVLGVTEERARTWRR